MSKSCVMLVAIEPSADVLGAALLSALRNRLGDGLRFVGVGGARMASLGLVSPFDTASLSVLGPFDALAAYPVVLRRARQTAALAARERPDIVVLIDAWGFNIRLARMLRRIDPDLPLIKYVAPQVWATRPGRARSLARAVDRLLTIHTFDAHFFVREGLPVTFVGTPALRRPLSKNPPDRLQSRLGAVSDQPMLLLLPGSRRGEIERLLGPFEEAVDKLAPRRPGFQVVIAAAEPVADLVKQRVARWRSRPLIIEGDEARLDAMRAATVALACSGTVTTELAAAGCPMVVAYRMGALSHLIVKRIIQTPYITLINVAAQAFVAPEMIQGRCNGADLAEELALRLDDADLRASQIKAQHAALEIMRGGIDDPAGAAAEAVIETLRDQRREKNLDQAVR